MPEKINWLAEGEAILDKVLEALDYWCWEVVGDPLDCYSTHQDLGLYVVAEEFVGWSRFKITDKDLEILSQMPEKYYKRLDAKFRKILDRVISNLMKKYGEIE